MRVLIRLRSDLDEVQEAKVLHEAEQRGFRLDRGYDGGYLSKLGIRCKRGEVPSETAVAQIRRLPGVLSVEIDAKRHVS